MQKDGRPAKAPPLDSLSHADAPSRQGHVLTEDELLSHCRELIAGYKLPRSIEFRSEPLPISGAGKILKNELRAPYWERMGRSVT